MPASGIDCEACGLPASRREFIRELSLTVASVLAALGVGSRAAAALPVSAVDALARQGSRHTYPIPAEDGVEIDRKAEIILVRWKGAVYAFNLSCPHQRTALRWINKDLRFKCPKHNSRYEPDGTFIDGRATRGMDRFDVAHEGTNVVVNVDAMHKQDVDPAGWTAAFVRLES
jgi:Rieske Fe-S protein